MKPKRKFMLGWNFLVPPALLCCMLIFTSCQTGKAAIERAAEKREKFVSDSIKYESVLEAFNKAEFMFRINRKGDEKLSPGESWVIFSGGDVYVQEVSLDEKGKDFAPLRWECSGPYRDFKKTVDKKKHTVTLSGNATVARGPSIRYVVVFSFTLFEGSDKGFGYIGSYTQPQFEGTYEPLTPATRSNFVPMDRW